MVVIMVCGFWCGEKYKVLWYICDFFLCPLIPGACWHSRWMRGGSIWGRRGALTLLSPVDHSDCTQLRGRTLRHRPQDRHPSAIPGWAHTHTHSQFTELYSGMMMDDSDEMSSCKLLFINLNLSPVNMKLDVSYWKWTICLQNDEQVTQ